MGKKVPDILLSGHHANVEKWRREQSIIRTLERRPELLEEANLSKKEKKFLNQLLAEKAEAERLAAEAEAQNAKAEAASKTAEPEETSAE